MAYTLKILSSEEFDKLPFKRAKGSLGAADAKRGVAYVRDTGYGDITKMTMGHELDELISKVSPHEEDGIRYKGGGGGGGFLSNLFGGSAEAAAPQYSGSFPTGGGITPTPRQISSSNAAAAGVPSAPSLSDFTIGGKGNAFQGFNANTAGQNFANFSNASAPSNPMSFNSSYLNPGGAFGQAIQPSSNTPQGSNFDLNSFSSALQANTSPEFNLKGSLGPQGTGSADKLFAQMGGPSGAAEPFNYESFSTPYNPGGSGSTYTPPPTSTLNTETPATQSTLQVGQDAGKTGEGDDGFFSGMGKQTMDTFQKILPGVGLALAGQAMTPKVDAPNFGPIREGLESRLSEENASPYRQAGANHMFGVLNDQLGTPPESAFTLGDIWNDEQLMKDLQGFDTYWKGIRPGADYQNDSEYQAQRAEIIERARERRAAARDQESYKYLMAQKEDKYRSAQSLLSLDDAQMQYYIQLAQLDVAEIVARTEIEAQEAVEMKQLFGDMGELLAQDALGQTGGGGLNITVNS